MNIETTRWYVPKYGGNRTSATPTRVRFTLLNASEQRAATLFATQSEQGIADNVDGFDKLAELISTKCVEIENCTIDGEAVTTGAELWNAIGSHPFTEELLEALIASGDLDDDLGKP